MTETKICRNKKCTAVSDPPLAADDPFTKYPTCESKTAKSNLIDEKSIIVIVDVDDVDDVELTLSNKVINETTELKI